MLGRKLDAGFRLANKRKAFAQRTRSNRVRDGVNSIASPLPVDADHPAALNRKCELPALQRKRGASFDFWRSKKALDAFNERALGLIADVGLSSQLINEILRHALRERVSAHDQRHRTGVVREI